MSENIFKVRLEIENPEILEEFKVIFNSLENFMIKGPTESLEYDLLIFEVGKDIDKEILFIQSIQSYNNTGEIFLTSTSADADILLKFIQTGIKGFFTQPLNHEDIKNKLMKIIERMESIASGVKDKKKGKIIDIIGTKGGVGTTTIAVNLATSLMSMEGVNSVALIDMNFLFGEIPLFLNLESNFDWAEVARNISRLDYTYLMSILSKHSSGIYVLHPPSGLEGNVATPDVIAQILSLMELIFDFIVIDSGQSIDDISLKILELSDEVLVVSILSLPCLINVKRLLNTFQKLGYPKDDNVNIVINRFLNNTNISLEEAEKNIDKKIIWVIPNDYHTTMSAINKGKTIDALYPEAEISQSFRLFAPYFSNKKIVKNVRKNNFFGDMLSKINEKIDSLFKRKK